MTSQPDNELRKLIELLQDCPEAYANCLVEST